MIETPKDDLKAMQNWELIDYFGKLIESGCEPDSRERNQARTELLDRLQSKTRYVKENGGIAGLPIQLLFFSEFELEILEDLTSEDHFYKRGVIPPIHQKILSILEVLRSKPKKPGGVI